MKKSLAVLLLLLPFVVFAQGKYDANWCFGKGAGIDFADTANPTIFSTGCDGKEACASISNRNGYLLFYLAAQSNFDTTYSILDRNGDLVFNGKGIELNTSVTNGAMILTDPSNDTRYFVFHEQVYAASAQTKLYYSIVEDSIDVPVIKEKNILLDVGPFDEKMVATHTADGKGWWLLLHYFADSSYCSNKYAMYQLTNRGVSFVHNQTIGSKICNPQLFQVGEMKFNGNGDRLVSCIYDSSCIDVFSFDRCTGLLGNFNVIKMPKDRKPYGCEIINNYIYVNTGFDVKKNTLFQVLVNPLNLLININTIFDDTTSDMYGGQTEIAPNGKIYVSSVYGDYRYSNYNSERLGVINHPDSLGSACDFQPFSFFLGDSVITYYGLPNMPNYNLGPLSTIWETGAGNDTSICANRDTLFKGVPLGGDSIAGVTATWQAATGIDNIHQLRQVVYPTQSQWYYVTLTDTTITGSCQSRLDSVYVQVVDCDTTGIGEATTSGIRIYPNPAHDQLVVECHLSDTRQQKSDNRFMMYDIMGQVVIEKRLTGTQTHIDVSTLPQGLYIYRIGNAVGKVQVVR